MYAISLLGAVIAIIIVFVASIISQRRKLDMYVRESFGKKRKDLSEALEQLEATETLYQCEKDRIPPHLRVDDITWDDLDMTSVFALADHADSYAGEQTLYLRLRDLSQTREQLESFEEKIEHFDECEQKRVEIRKKLCNLGKPYTGYDIPAAVPNIESHRLRGSFVFYLLSAALIASAIAAVILRTPHALILCGTVYCFNLVVHIIRKATMDMMMKTVFNIGAMINTAQKISSIDDTFSGEIAAELESMRSTTKAARRLERHRSKAGDDEASVLVAYLLGPFMIDLILYDRLMRKLCGKKDETLRLYRYIGDIDCAISIASYRRSIKKTCCVPQITDDDTFLLDSVVHPVIPKAVPNDFEFRRNVIITGSNASGKSTFIKAAAINLILGQTIHTCTANCAVIPKCSVITSMAVRDDLLSGESYYIREIKYLKRMIEFCSPDRLLFLAIDEILKGTNTKERIAASKSILTYLSQNRCMLMVATHDLELAKMFEKSCDNYHFSEVIGSGDVSFDYALRKGISNSSNAIKLLCAMGFPEQITDAAQKEVESSNI